MNSTFSLSQLADDLESRIRGNRLMDLGVDWQDELVFPAYDGLSLMNIPNTIAILLDAGDEAAPGLDAAIWGGDLIAGTVDRVVLMISDGLGYLWLKHLIETDDTVATAVDFLTDGRGPLPLTSVVPSTTAVALPTLWTGASPAAHGMVGTKLFLRELSMLVDMLSLRPVKGVHHAGVIADWGVSPEGFIPVQTLGERLSGAGVPGYLLLPKGLGGSGLSRIMHRGITSMESYYGDSDIWLRVRDMLSQTANQRCFVNIYLPTVDGLSHLYGADARYIENEVRHQLTGLQDVLADTALHDGRTLFLLVADHGHHDARNWVNLAEDEAAAPIYRAMRGLVGAESRFGYLYLQHALYRQAVDTLRTAFADCFAAIDAPAALAAGLFGPGKAYTETIHRLGDLIVLGRLNWRLIDPVISKSHISVHGGLSDWEMLIPFLWKRL